MRTLALAPTVSTSLTVLALTSGSEGCSLQATFTIGDLILDVS